MQFDFVTDGIGEDLLRNLTGKPDTIHTIRNEPSDISRTSVPKVHIWDILISQKSRWFCILGFDLGVC